MRPHSRLYWRTFRLVMRIAHHFHWCYMQPLPVIEKDRQQVWCRWCGARYTHYTGTGPITAIDAALAGAADSTDPVIHAQHDETGRMWTGPRSQLPRRYFECVTDDAYAAQVAGSTVTEVQK